MHVVSDDKPTHALFVQAVQLQALRSGRAGSARPGNFLDGVQGMDEDSICPQLSVSRTSPCWQGNDEGYH